MRSLFLRSIPRIDRRLSLDGFWLRRMASWFFWCGLLQILLSRI
jgi:hypothetical protein